MSLKISHLTKRFGNFTALKDLSFEIEQGEFLAILGPSGCGKTTLLRIIAGFESPTEGTVENDGVLFASTKASIPVEKRNLGMVFQSFALWPHMTVREHVEFPLKSKRCTMTEEEKRNAVNNAIQAMRLDTMEDRYPGELSGGQKQRVALARAIVERPAILLMDEPLSALDAELKISMRKEIQDIHHMTGATIIYITHDQSEALALADRILIMKDGEIEQLGTPEAIYQHPATEFAATFVSKCNLVAGAWTGGRFCVPEYNFFIDGSDIAQTFIDKGVYPIRPDEFEMAREGEGIPGVVTNRQYNGRENHYTVQSGEAFYTVYAPDTVMFEEGETIRLRKRDVHHEASAV